MWGFTLSVDCPLRSADFFLLRTPSLSVQSRSELRARYCAGESLANSTVVQSPFVREALFLASRNLYQRALEGSKETDDRMDFSLARYLFRMATRCTPFGLFAGVSLGEVTKAFDLRVIPSDAARRVCRIDQDVITQIHHQLFRHSASRIDSQRQTTVTLNSSSWNAPDGLRYTEYVSGKDRPPYYRLARLDLSPALAFAAAKLKNGSLSFVELSQAIAAEFACTTEEADQFLSQLIDEQVLFCNPQITVTGDNSVRNFVDQLGNISGAERLARPLQQAADKLDAVDDNSARNIELYREVDQLLTSDALGVDEAKTIQVDLHKVGVSTPALPKETIDTILSQIWALRSVLAKPPLPELQRFASEFNDTYGDASVPLLEALDPDFGLAFGDNSQINSPVLRDITAERSFKLELSDTADVLLLRQAERAWHNGLRNITLHDEFLDELGTKEQDYPSSFCVIGAFHASSSEAAQQGQFTFNLTGLSGTPAAGILARFCTGNSVLKDKVRQLIASAEDDMGETIVAELAHQPAGRIGNVMLRPVLRNFELPYLGQSGVDSSKALSLEDIYISCRSGRITLTSRKLGKRILLRITNAHAFSGPQNLALYRFLGALQFQGEPITKSPWGELESVFAFLPGLQYRNVILSRPKWRLGGDDLKKIADHASKNSESPLAPLANARDVRHIRIQEGDNFLELDLAEELDRALLVNECRRKTTLIIEERPQDECELASDTSGTPLRHQIVLPVIRCHPAEKVALSSTDLLPIEKNAAFSPGSNWIYARAYCGSSIMDDVIQNAFAPFYEATETLGGTTAFYIRYGDGGQHLRIRAKANTAENSENLRHILEKLLSPYLDDRRISRLEYATYHPEYRRYGGITGLPLCEKIFSADSIAIATMLKEIWSLDDREDYRWKIGLACIRDTFRAFSLGHEAEISIANSLVSGYQREFGFSRSQRDLLNLRYRDHRKAVDTIIADGWLASDTIATILRTRHASTAEAAFMLKDLPSDTKTETVASLVHMTVNRIFPERARLHEMALLHFFAKSSASLEGRRRFSQTVKPMRSATEY